MVFLVNINDFLYLVVAAHENPRPVMNMLGDDCKHTLHTTVDRLSASWGVSRQHKMRRRKTQAFQASR